MSYLARHGKLLDGFRSLALDGKVRKFTYKGMGDGTIRWLITFADKGLGEVEWNTREAEAFLVGVYIAKETG